VLDQGQGTDKLLMPTRPNNKGNWMYKSLSDDQNKGTIVDFMLRRGHSYQEIANLSGPILPVQVLDQQRHLPEQLKDPALQQELAQDKLASFQSGGGKSYLEKRGIERVAYQGIKGIKTNYQGAIFGLYDQLDIQGQGRLCSTIQYRLQTDGSSDKYFQKGLPRGLSVLIPSQEIKELVLTESPIDALSHKQLYGGEHTLYLSTCGSLGQGIVRSLEEVLLEAKKQAIGVKLCFDKDEAGEKMVKQVISIASKQGISCQVQWPSKGKDWNEMLLASQEKVIPLNKLNSSAAFSRSL
jgi:hypothetical protein